MRAAFLCVTLAVAFAGCTTDESLSTCQTQAQAHGTDVTVAAGRSTTVLGVRNLQPNLQPPRWPELAADSSAVICYLNGPFGNPPGGGTPYDRAVVAVAGDHADIVILGYADEMPIPSN